MISLPDALHTVARQLGLDALDLRVYADEDLHGGYPEVFPSGSMWRVEGQFLYALIRALKPLRVLEIGTMHGCSATHILQALTDNGGKGRLTCVDSGIQIADIGDMIPDALRENAAISQVTIEAFIEAYAYRPYDFILEDAMHSPEQVEFIYRALPSLLTPGGVIVSHDAAHHLVGADVTGGIHAAGYTPQVYAIAPADCGFSVYQYRGDHG